MANGGGGQSTGVPGGGGAAGAIGIGGSVGLGMSCSDNQQCPSDTICCNASTKGCSGTRLPVGNSTDPGEYEVSADGQMVSDTITGLLWQRDVSGARAGCHGKNNNLTCTWNEAQSYCASLSLAGLSGWRLPGVMELATLLDLSRSNPAIDPAAFPGTPAEAFWSSSPSAMWRTTDSSAAWAVDFKTGTNDIADAQATYARARCVRGSRCHPRTRFEVLDGGVVHDALTNLYWHRYGSADRAMSWWEAEAYCAGSGFRLPTLKELLSIVGFEVAHVVSIDQDAFPVTRVEGFWTSTPVADDPNSRWQVYFGGGDAYPSPYGGTARCVR